MAASVFLLYLASLQVHFTSSMGFLCWLEPELTRCNASGPSSPSSHSPEQHSPSPESSSRPPAAEQSEYLILDDPVKPLNQPVSHSSPTGRVESSSSPSLLSCHSFDPPSKHFSEVAISFSDQSCSYKHCVVQIDAPSVDPCASPFCSPALISESFSHSLVEASPASFPATCRDHSFLALIRDCG